MNILPNGIFNLSCSFLNAWSTIQRVIFSVSSAGKTTFAAELVGVCGAETVPNTEYS